MPLKTKQGFPPSGYIFFQPETGWSAPFPMSDDFDRTVQRIIEHRLKNPRFGLSIDTAKVAEELDIFTCTRLKHDPYWCTYKNGEKKKSPAQRIRSPYENLVGLVERARQSAQGLQILNEWIGEGGFPVSTELANKRAKVCVSCPLNEKDDWKNKVTESVAELIHKHREIKSGLNLRTGYDQDLGTCGACGCHLPLKVWVPPKHLKATNEVEFPDYCWNATESHQSLLIVIPFYKGDYKQAKDLLEWIEELGGCKNNSILLLSDIKVPVSDINVLRDLASKSFAEVHVKTTPHSLPNERWPIGPNWMFETACRHINDNFSNPWLWLEPDALPLKPGWLQAMESEYNTCGKPFMGAVVSSSGQPNLPGDHLTGVAIYPQNAHEYLKVNYGKKEAFDMTSASIVLPHTHHTRLHYHFWGQKDLAPVFKADNSPDNPKNTLLLKTIPQEAFLMHRCKNSSLLQLLRLTK